MAAHVYLSPHLDDIPLSCGGLAALTSAAGEYGLSVTLFAGPPAADTPLTPYAAQLHARWGDPDPAGGNALRRAEERAALTLLGLDLALLDYPDAVYRQGRYLSRADIFGTLHPGDNGLAEQLAQSIDGLLRERGIADDATIYAPLGLGHHVDHQLAFQAAGLLAASGRLVIYYEDYPYASRPAAHADRFAELGYTSAGAALVSGHGMAMPAYCNIDPVIATKIAAIAAYPSQLTSLFPSAEAMPAAVRDYAAAVAAEWRRDAPPGAGELPRYAERYWRLAVNA